MMIKKLFIILILCSAIVKINAQSGNSFDIDTVEAQKYDMGKMWTFENPPLEYFEQLYGFKPSDEWIDKVQKAALKFGNGCSASFISEDGLILTNHHCVRGLLPQIQSEDEDLLKNGFYAEKIEEERKIPGLFVEQLLLIEDVTDEVITAMQEGEDDSSKVEKHDEKFNEIKERYLEQNPELMYKVVSLYNGGKYSLYGYKRYNDIRLVFVPELQAAKLGGDYDNFTYPRYGLDCAFLRAYDEEGNPVKCHYYFNWSDEPVYEDQPVFVVGNPGSTNRIFTIAQLEYIRDYKYGLQTPMRKDLYNIYEDLVNETNAEDTKLIAKLYSVGNGLKVYSETYKALQNPVFIARKKDFEKKFKEAVQSDPELNNKYGNIWDEIADNRKQASEIAKELFAYKINPYYSTKYFFIASDLIDLAEHLKLPEDERDSDYVGANLENITENIFPEDFNKELEDKMLLVQVNIIQSNLDPENEVVKKMFDGKTGKGAVDFVLVKSQLTTKEDVIHLSSQGADSILNSNDPFIYFILNTKDKLAGLQSLNKKLEENIAVNNQLLGEALYKVYGDTIPPDATGTLRISDGIVKGFDYNGTRAPIKTTFYGSLDRYFSFDKKFPFDLPSYWENLPTGQAGLPGDFDLSTTLDFVSTNDIIGGNSGSPVLNTDKEIVGVAFDGNIESHSGNFIYTTEANRTVSVSADGMLEAIHFLYKAEGLYLEIINGRIK